MGFSSEAGYIPVSIETIMDELMEGINDQFGTTYTNETFIGTNFYKYFYALAQRMQENEVLTSEIFASLQQYFEITNERILRPVATNPGLVEAFEDSDWIASVKPMIEADAGTVNICVDVDDEGDDYAAEKLEIATIIKDSVAAGVVSLGAESETIVLSNGQSFDFKFHLPTRTDVHLRLTLTTSDNNQVVIDDPEDVKQRLIDNIEEKYRLGLDFEPQRYFTTADALWTSEVLLEYSIDAGENWLTAINEAEFDDLYEFDLANITLVEE
jgi:hypothetical protein